MAALAAWPEQLGEVLMESGCNRDMEAARPRVLVAEDQPTILEALRFLLKVESFQAEFAQSPANVVEALQNSHFDVVLMDLNYSRDTTSGNEGLELLARIQQMDNTLPVVVMTAWGSIELAVEAMRRGAADFIQKPWDNRRLLDVLQAQMERGQAMRKWKRARQLELQEASEIQKRLLPDSIPQIAGFEISAAWQPASVVGGDYFDVIRLGENKLAICVADAVGKGMPAALLMSNLQASVKALVREDLEPGDLCRKLNSAMASSLTQGKFISFFYAVLDGTTSSFTCCNCGHNPPILVRSSGEQRELDCGGAVLGELGNCAYEQEKLSLRSGDRLLLFTDGVTEARSMHGEEFGEQRLVELVRNHSEESGALLQTRLMGAVSQHCDGRFEDDATLIVMAVN